MQHNPNEEITSFYLKKQGAEFKTPEALGMINNTALYGALWVITEERFIFHVCSPLMSIRLFLSNDGAETAFLWFSEVIENDIKRTDQQHNDADNLHRNH